MTNQLLLDTHVYIWARSDPRRLTAAERRLLTSADRLRVSVASLWEITILGALGRLARAEELLATAPGYELLPIEPAHCRELMALPPLHRDPFDRMLIAQARYEEIPLLTRDAAIAAYGASGAAMVARS